jgi:DNA sulfur modification protein DndE
LELNGLDFKRVKLSEESTKKLQLFKSRTGITPNIACRLALGVSLGEESIPSLELFVEETGQEINRYTLLGEHELVLLALFTQWCHDQKIPEKKHYKYFLAHLNRGVELLTNRVKGLDGLPNLLKDGQAR